MNSPHTISNQEARNLAIYYAGLTNNPTGQCNQNTLLSLIERLGYVQLDPLKVIARAHDHILWSRNNHYRPAMLDKLLEDHKIYEHFCHDACVLPMQLLPHWANQFKRQSEKLTSARWRDNLKRKDVQTLLKRIKQEGALRSLDFKAPKQDTHKKIWTKPEHKKILDYLWLKGELAVSKRQNFTKYYQLAERVYPHPLKAISNKAHIHWLTENALRRLGFGTPTEITKFWEGCSLSDTKKWCEINSHCIERVLVECSDGDTSEAILAADQKPVIRKPPEPTRRLRIINPFDPLVRDRKRLARLFGFDYKIEIYVPPDKRLYGYYVYPILEFNRFVGRIEVTHSKAKNELVVDNLWPEKGVKFGVGRMAKLRTELERLRKFCHASKVVLTI